VIRISTGLPGAHFRRGGVREVDGLARGGHLRVEQLVDPPGRVNLAEGAPHVLMVDFELSKVLHASEAV
jgi:hypothetical protein